MRLLLLAGLWSLVVVCCGYETGAPVVDYPEICVSMFPSGHNASAMTTPPPFTASVDCFKDIRGWMRVTYTVHSTHDPIEGIFIQARKVKSDGSLETQAVGRFLTADPVLKTVDCGMSQNAVSHREEKKARSRIVWWSSDRKIDGQVKFVATVLLHKKEFWTFVESAEVGMCGGASMIGKFSFVTSLVAVLVSLVIRA